MRVPPLAAHLEAAASLAGLAGAVKALAEMLENRLGISTAAASFEACGLLEGQALRLAQGEGVSVATPTVVEAAVWKAAEARRQRVDAEANTVAEVRNAVDGVTPLRKELEELRAQVEAQAIAAEAAADELRVLRVGLEGAAEAGALRDREVRSLGGAVEELRGGLARAREEAHMAVSKTNAAVISLQRECHEAATVAPTPPAMPCTSKPIRSALRKARSSPSAVGHVEEPTPDGSSGAVEADNASTLPAATAAPAGAVDVGDASTLPAAALALAGHGTAAADDAMQEKQCLVPGRAKSSTLHPSDEVVEFQPDEKEEDSRKRASSFFSVFEGSGRRSTTATTRMSMLNLSMHGELAPETEVWAVNLEEHLEKLEQEEWDLRRDVKQAAVESLRHAKEEAGSAVHHSECQLRAELEELRNWVQVRLEEGLEDLRLARGKMAISASEAAALGQRSGDSGRASVRTGSDADAERRIRRVTAQVDILCERVDAADQKLAVSLEAAKKRAESGEEALRDFVTQFRDRDLRAQAEAHDRLREATGSIAGGLLRLAEICGLFPPPQVPSGDILATSAPQAGELLDRELCGQSIRKCLEEAWNCIGHGQASLLELTQERAELVARRLVKVEVGDVDMRVERLCAGMGRGPACVLAATAAKSGGLPAAVPAAGGGGGARWEAGASGGGSTARKHSAGSTQLPLTDSPLNWSCALSTLSPLSALKSRRAASGDSQLSA
mmetsp:Transcript_66889/g.150277  ORF Transcript_66889/g.150277 Transcript_66889/m.150277 type:complete len:729 (+) Transcript_66889:63-2249(+)